MARADGENRQVGTTASMIMVIAVGAVVAYLGFTMVRFGLYAFGEGEALIAVGSLAIGAVFLAGVTAVVVSQVRAWLRGRSERQS